MAPENTEKLAALTHAQYLAAQHDTQRNSYEMACPCGYQGHAAQDVQDRPWAYLCPQCGKLYYLRAVEGEEGHLSLVPYEGQQMVPIEKILHQ